MVGHSVIGMALIAEAGVLLKGRPVWEQVYGAVPGRSIVVLRSRAVLLNDHYP